MFDYRTIAMICVAGVPVDYSSNLYLKHLFHISGSKSQIISFFKILPTESKSFGKELEKLWDRLSVTPAFGDDNWELG